MDVIGVCEPVPVGLVAFVSALVSEGLFVGPHEVAVPGKEETIAMDSHSQIDMDSNEVIVPRLRGRGPEGVGFGRFRLETLHSLDVVLSFWLGHELPK